jgi:hypothetical protein
MAKIECPHCHAVNQDVSLSDPCWKCGTVLSAPPSALETSAGPPTSEANAGVSSPPKPRTKVQQALAESETTPPAPIYAEPPVPASPSRTAMYIGIGVLVVALIILLVIFLLNRH